MFDPIFRTRIEIFLLTFSSCDIDLSPDQKMSLRGQMFIDDNELINAKIEYVFL